MQRGKPINYTSQCPRNKSKAVVLENVTSPQGPQSKGIAHPVDTDIPAVNTAAALLSLEFDDWRSSPQNNKDNLHCILKPIVWTGLFQLTSRNPIQDSRSEHLFICFKSQEWTDFRQGWAQGFMYFHQDSVSVSLIPWPYFLQFGFNFQRLFPMDGETILAPDLHNCLSLFGVAMTKCLTSDNT